MRWWEDRRGLVHLSGCFDPVTAAPIKNALDALVSADLHAARDAKSRLAADAMRSRVGDGDGAAARREAASWVDAGSRAGAASRDAGSQGDTGPGELDRVPDATDRAFVDPRTIQQMAADALSDLARLAVASADASPALANATLVARIDLKSLLDGLGHASIDGIDQPISASSARMMAASAGLIPMVCGDAGEVLDLGRRRRLFSRAQRIALAERDGGCAHPDCARPVAHTQAHHIEHWQDTGPTDLANGVLLCAFHHWMIHHDGWQILLVDGRVWFRPPARLDPEQRLRPGRRAARLELADAMRPAA